MVWKSRKNKTKSENILYKRVDFKRNPPNVGREIISDLFSDEIFSSEN